MTLVKFSFSTWKGICIGLFYQIIITFSFILSDKNFFNQMHANYIKKRSRKKKKIANPNLKASEIMQKERKISFPSLVWTAHIMLVQVSKTSNVSLYSLHLQRPQTPSVFLSILMEISSPLQYFGFEDIQCPLNMQYIGSFIQSKSKVGLHTLGNHSPWTLQFYQWKLWVIKLVSIY